MPVFPGQTDFQKELGNRNVASLKSVGFQVVTVPTNAGQMKGSIHCLVNALD